MKRFIQVVAVLIFVFPLARISAQVISNPVQDLLSRIDYTPGEQIYRLDADLNHDGTTDVLLCFAHSLDSDSGGEAYIWHLYIGTAGGYLRAGIKTPTGYVDMTGLVHFRKDLYFVGYIPEIGGYGLLTLNEASAKGKGPQIQLKAIVITGTNSCQEVLIGSPVGDTQAFPLRQRFGTVLMPAVTTIIAP